MSAASESTGTDIVLVSRKARVDKWIEEEQYGARKKDGSVRMVHSSAEGGSSFARYEGDEAGRAADTGDRRVGYTSDRKELT